MDYLGVELDGNFLNFCLIDRKKRVLDFKTFEVSNVKQLYIKDQKFSKKITIVSALPSKNILLKKRQVKIKNKKKIIKAIPFQAQSCCCLEKEKSLVLPIITKNEALEHELFFHITSKTYLKNHLDLLHSVDLDPDYVSSETQGLLRFSTHYFPEVKNLFMLHIGFSQTHLIHLENGYLKNSLTIKIGSSNFIKAYNLDLPARIPSKTKIDFSRLCKKGSMPNFEKQITLFIQETRKGLLGFLEKHKNLKLPFLISGQVASLPSFEDFFLKEHQEHLSESLKIKESFLLPYALPMGLALDGLKRDDLSLQFRQEEFLPLKHLKKMGKKLFFFIFSSLIFSVTAFFFGLKTITLKEKNLLNQITKIQKEEKIASNDFTLKDFEKEMTLIQKKIKEENTLPFYFPLAPKVSSVLQWLNNWSSLNSLKEEDFEILSFKYTLESFPKIEEQKNPYLTKISLSLKIKNPTLAKKFYQGLLKDKIIFDKNKKTTWRVENDLYQTTFYLKNLTPQELYVNEN